MTACHICGTRTGQHGFSWDKDKWTPPEPKRCTGGILMIPERLIPDDEDPEEYLKKMRETLNQYISADYPSFTEVRLMHDPN